MAPEPRLGLPHAGAARGRGPDPVRRRPTASRRFEITDAGREHLESRADEPEPWQPVDDEGENAITELAPLVIQIGKAAWQVATVGDEAQRARAIEVLAETRRALYRILAEDAGGRRGRRGPREPASPRRRRANVGTR